MLRAGIDDWGGVSPGHGRPRQPGAAVARRSTSWPPGRRRPGSRCASGSPPTRSTCWPARRGSTPGCTRTSPRWPTRRPGWPARTPSSRAGRGRSRTAGSPPPAGSTCNTAIDTDGRTADRRGDFASVYGDWDVAARGAGRHAAGRPRRGSTPTSRPGWRWPHRTRPRCSTRRTPPPRWPLILADGPALEELTRLADAVRADVVGDEVTYVVNRNINFSNVCYVGLPVLRLRPARARRRRVPALARRGRRPRGRGGAERAPPRCACRAASTRSCRSPSTPTWCARCRPPCPDMHVHAFSPMEIVSAAAKAGVSIGEWLTELRDAGLGSIPGTAAEILDDEVRWVLTKGKLPAAQWLEVVRHRAPAGHPVVVDDDVRARRRAAALARAPAHAGRAAGRDGRLHRVRAAAVRAPQRADLPGGPRPARARPSGTTGPCTRSPGSRCTAGSTTSSARG